MPISWVSYHVLSFLAQAIQLFLSWCFLCFWGFLGHQSSPISLRGPSTRTSVRKLGELTRQGWCYVVVADKNGPEEWHGVEGQRFLGFRKGGVAELLSWLLSWTWLARPITIYWRNWNNLCYVYFLVQWLRKFPFWLPCGNLFKYCWLSSYEWRFSIAMLVYQGVTHVNPPDTEKQHCNSFVLLFLVGGKSKAAKIK